MSSTIFHLLTQEIPSTGPADVEPNVSRMPILNKAPLSLSSPPYHLSAARFAYGLLLRLLGQLLSKTTTNSQKATNAADSM